MSASPNADKGRHPEPPSYRPRPDRMGYLVVDHDRDDKRVRGPFDHAETAEAVRRELEHLDPHYSQQGNLWIIEVAGLGAGS